MRLVTLISIFATGCSCGSPGGDTTTDGTPPPNGQSDSSTNDVELSDAVTAADAPDDASQPSTDAATDMSAPLDVSVDMNSADVSVDMNVDMGLPPVNDATPPPPADMGVADTGDPNDSPAPDVGDPGVDAACASTLTGVDLFRCQALAYGKPYEFLEDLTSNVGPRLAGSAGSMNAVTWATAKLTSFGLQNVHTEPVTVPHWKRGAESAEIVGTTPTPLAIAALGGSIATPAGGLEAEVIEVKSLSDFSAINALGKIVFLNGFMQRTKDASGYHFAFNDLLRGPSEAAARGAVGFIVRSITAATDNAPHTGKMYSASIPAVAIGPADAVVLSNAVKAGITRVRMTLGCQTLPDVETANVIGEFVGKVAPNEILLLGAHLDSWDLGTGALDDGAGMAMTVEAARLISVYAPDTRRTVRVVLWAGEEMGTHGGIAYASAHSSEIANHVMALEADLGADRVYAVAFNANSSLTAIIQDILAPLAPLGLGPAIGGGNIAPGAGSLASRGVPTAALLQDVTRYYDFHHAATDTMAAVDRAQLEQATAAAAVFAYQIARNDLDLRPRVPPDAAFEH